MTTPLLGPDYRPLLSVEGGLVTGIGIVLCAGLIVGAFARLVAPRQVPGGTLASLGLGAAGALLAGVLGVRLAWFDAGGGVSIIAAMVGAIVLLWLYREIRAGWTQGAR
jgi:uncharacterized membrane protein YeaQ/YmgE (transglycosylase-associated protein family)